MDNRNEAREFLMSCRTKLVPEQAGLTVSGRRRVAGLRRDAVLEALVRALQLDVAERQHLIDRGPAFVRNGRMDILATNALGRAFHDEVLDGPGQGNPARSCFLGKLSTLSDAFRIRWGADHVRRHGSGTKVLVHHDVGEITLTDEGMELAAEPGLSFLIHTAAKNQQKQEIERATSGQPDSAGNEKESRS